MENQHKLIKGYRNLSEKEISLMNKIKTVAEEVGSLCEELKTELLYEKEAIKIEATRNGNNLDEYKTILEALLWAERGRFTLQEGFMKLTRSIARPTTF